MSLFIKKQKETPKLALEQEPQTPPTEKQEGHQTFTPKEQKVWDDLTILSNIYHLRERLYSTFFQEYPSFLYSTPDENENLIKFDGRNYKPSTTIDVADINNALRDYQWNVGRATITPSQNDQINNLTKLLDKLPRRIQHSDIDPEQFRLLIHIIMRLLQSLNVITGEESDHLELCVSNCYPLSYNGYYHYNLKKFEEVFETSKSADTSIFE